MVIPEGVTRIRFNAFDEWINLKTITFNKDVNYIENNVFSNCFSLHSCLFLGTNNPTFFDDIFSSYIKFVNVTSRYKGDTFCKSPVNVVPYDFNDEIASSNEEVIVSSDDDHVSSFVDDFESTIDASDKADEKTSSSSNEITTTESNSQMFSSSFAFDSPTHMHMKSDTPTHAISPTNAFFYSSSITEDIGNAIVANKSTKKNKIPFSVMMLVIAVIVVLITVAAISISCVKNKNKEKVEASSSSKKDEKKDEGSDSNSGFIRPESATQLQRHELGTGTMRPESTADFMRPDSAFIVPESTIEILESSSLSSL